MSSVMYTGASDEGPICDFTSDQIRSEKVVKIKEVWGGGGMACAQMTSCLSPSLFHGTHRREHCISFEQPGELQHSPSCYFGGIHWNETSQKSSSEGHRYGDKGECWRNHMRFIKFTLPGHPQCHCCVLELEKVKWGDGFQTGMQTSFVDI